MPNIELRYFFFKYSSDYTRFGIFFDQADCIRFHESCMPSKYFLLWSNVGIHYTRWFYYLPVATVLPYHHFSCLPHQVRYHSLHNQFQTELQSTLLQKNTTLVRFHKALVTRCVRPMFPLFTGTAG